MLDRCLHILKHRGPRPLLRMADRKGERSCPTKRGLGASRLLAQARGIDGSHLCFDNGAGRLALAWWRVATKTSSKLDAYGPGMHWERGNVNPMLALRNAVCNDRWREMWQKALNHHRKLRALQRSDRATQRAQACLSVCNPCLSDSPSSAPPSAASQELSPPAPSPVATSPRSSLPSTGRKHRPARHRVNTPHPGSSELRRDTCLCGTPLARFKGHRPKRYCSDRC